MNPGEKKRISPARAVALVGIMAATVECGKLVLAFLPNIEIVTLLLAIYGYVFGISGVVAALVFVSAEPLIWGFNTWVISYCLYWPFVAALFMLLSCLGKRHRMFKNRFLFAGFAVIMTAWFGVLTTLVDTGILSGFFENFWFRFSVMYVRGVPFFITHIISNAVLFVLVFPFLAEKLERLKSNMFR